MGFEKDYLYKAAIIMKIYKDRQKRFLTELKILAVKLTSHSLEFAKLILLVTRFAFRFFDL